MEKLVRKIGLVAHDAMKKDLIEWVHPRSPQRKTSRCEVGLHHLEIRSFGW